MANRVAWLTKRVKIGGQWFVRKPIIKPTGFVTEKVIHNGQSVHAPGTFVLEWYEAGKRQRVPLSASTSEAQDALGKKRQTLDHVNAIANPGLSSGVLHLRSNVYCLLLSEHVDLGTGRL
jgi:hypothetical protein